MNKRYEMSLRPVPSEELAKMRANALRDQIVTFAIILKDRPSGIVTEGFLYFSPKGLSIGIDKSDCTFDAFLSRELMPLTLATALGLADADPVFDDLLAEGAFEQIPVSVQGLGGNGRLFVGKLRVPSSPSTRKIISTAMGLGFKSSRGKTQKQK